MHRARTVHKQDSQSNAPDLRALLHLFQLTPAYGTVAVARHLIVNVVGIICANVFCHKTSYPGCLSVGMKSTAQVFKDKAPFGRYSRKQILFEKPCRSSEALR